MTSDSKSNGRPSLIALALLVLIAAAVAAVVTHAQQVGGWKPVEGKQLSRSGRDVSPANALPDYPRPQLVRSAWLSLNGLWQDALRPKHAAGPGATYDGAILVPFAPESSLSILILKARMQESGSLSEEEFQALDGECKQSSEEAARFAEESPEPAPESLYEDVLCR